MRNIVFNLNTEWTYISMDNVARYYNANAGISKLTLCNGALHP